MNQPTPARRTVDPDRRRSRAMAEKRRRRRRARLYFRIRQVLLILVSLCIGFMLGRCTANPEAAAESAPAATTQPPAEAVQTTSGPLDTAAPRILGVNKLSVFIGSTIAYRSGILVEDDLDPAPKLTVDSSRVNLSTPGIYPVIYTATDSAGNTASVETTITVKEAPETYVDEALIQETADALLAQILTEGMTTEQQVTAIYDWIEMNCIYIAEFDKSDYMQAAYLMLTDHRGDCYGFYAVSRLLFERLNLPNLTVTRMKNEVRTTNHWWNMVSLDGGQTWYHFDATPHLTNPFRSCLVTDAKLEEFNQAIPNYYYYDREAVPRTPEA